jgi:hypothetical protein
MVIGAMVTNRVLVLGDVGGWIVGVVEHIGEVSIYWLVLALALPASASPRSCQRRPLPRLRRRLARPDSRLLVLPVPPRVEAAVAGAEVPRRVASAERALALGSRPLGQG